MKEWFTTFGYNVMLAAGGSEALEVFRSRQFDCIICDIQMPEKDGFAVLNAVRQQDPHVPFVIISGYLTQSKIERLKQEGASDYMAKPFYFHDILAKVEQLTKSESE